MAVLIWLNYRFYYIFDLIAVLFTNDKKACLVSQSLSWFRIFFNFSSHKIYDLSEPDIMLMQGKYFES